MNFKDYDLSENIQKGIDRLGFQNPTEIQTKSFKPIKAGRDMIAQSQTGTGKTAAFTLPILDKIDVNDRSPQVVIMCPTRELAVQVAEAIKELAFYIRGLNVVPVYGGEPIFQQIKQLRRGAHVIVGTPGRLHDHLRRKTINASKVHTVILDEADEMLKMGFKEEIDNIFADMPKGRQTLLFSATMPKPVIRIAQSYQTDPEHIQITQKELTNANIEQEYYLVQGKYKTEAVARLIKVQNPSQALIFCNTKKGVDELMDNLAPLVTCEKIHGDIPQNLRLDTISRFNNGNLKFLIATDVAARGLDIKGVEIVYNYDVPSHPENYVHRIGRTGRAGRSGIACTLVSRNEQKHLAEVVRYSKKQMTKKSLPSISEVNLKSIDHTVNDIKTTIETADLQNSNELLEKMIEAGLSANEIASALIFKSLKLDDRKEIDISYRQSDSNRNHNSRDNNRTSRHGRSSQPAVNGDLVHVRMNVGYDDDVQVREILGFIRAKSNVSKNVIGNISMRNSETFLEVPKASVSGMVAKLNGISMGTKKIKMDVPNTVPSSVTRKRAPRKKTYNDSKKSNS